MSIIRNLFLFFILVNVGVCESPLEVLTAYKRACQAGDFEKGWGMTAKNKVLPERLQQQQRDLARPRFDRLSGGSDFEILTERIDGDCALIIVNEFSKGGQVTIDLDPVYFIRQDGEWKVCRTQKLIELIAPDKAPVFAKLQAWFEGFKQGVKWQENRKAVVK